MRRIAVMLVACFALSFMACEGKKPPTNAGPRAKEEKQAVKKTWTRDEFEKSLVGKTKDEVTDLVGKPARTSSKNANGEEFWSYDDFTVDPATGKTDRISDVHFKDDKVVRVSCRG